MKSRILSLLLLVFASRYAASSVAITTSSLPKGTVNTAYSATIHATDGCIPYQWAIVSGALPAGVTATVSSTTTALNLSGTPTTAATDSFAVEVTGCEGHVSQVSYEFVIQAGRSYVGITTTSLPNGTVNTAYSAVVHASGGCTPYKWTLASGALPAGVTATVSSTTTSLTLSGTPITPATDSLGIRVTGCGGIGDGRIVVERRSNQACVDLLPGCSIWAAIDVVAGDVARCRRVPVQGHSQTRRGRQQFPTQSKGGRLEADYSPNPDTHSRGLVIG
jgi:hypothetical protein